MAKRDVLKEQYIETRLEIVEFEERLRQLYDDIEATREQIFEADGEDDGVYDDQLKALLDEGKHDTVVTELNELRRQAITYEQRPSSRIAGLTPLIGEWGVRNELIADADGVVRRAVLVNPSVQQVAETLLRKGHSPDGADDDDIFGDVMRNPKSVQMVHDLKLLGSYNLPELLKLSDMNWVTRLDLSNAPLSAMDWINLAKCDNLAQVETLDLSNTGTGRLGVLELLHSRKLPALETMILGRKPATKPRDPRLKKLVNCVDRSDRLSTAELQAMAARVHRSHIEFVLKGKSSKMNL